MDVLSITCMSPSCAAVIASIIRSPTRPSSIARSGCRAGSSRLVPLPQFSPRRAGAQHPEDAVQHTPAIDAGHTSRLVGRNGEQRRHSKSAKSYRLMPTLNQTVATREILAVSEATRPRFGEGGIDRKQRPRNLHQLKQRNHLIANPAASRPHPICRECKRGIAAR